MRVTENRMIEVAAAGVARARNAAAEAGKQVSSGVRVERPQDDPTAWVEGQRAAVRATVNDAHGSAIARSQERLAETDRVLSVLGGALDRAQELAIQMTNGTLDADARANAATELRALRDSALAAVNEAGADGEHLLAGDFGDLMPFDPSSGLFVGDSAVRKVETGEGVSLESTVSGERLTAARGVDVFAVLGSLADALEANDVPTARGALDGLRTSIDQTASARGEAGSRMAALNAAEDARQSFAQRLAEMKSRALDADPIAAATALARTSTALQAARASAEQIIALAGRQS